MTTREKILFELKKYGVQTSQQIAETLGMTNMGARQHLLSMEEEGVVVCCQMSASGRGRPSKGWELTQKADIFFPDAHRDLSLDILEGVKTLFGQEGLDKLIDQRSETQRKVYEKELSQETSLGDRLDALSTVRSKEGYMAEKIETDDGYLFIENHCPICEAAKVCTGLCNKELEIFKSLFQGIADVERTEHKVSGARRCAYKVSPKS
ncbi:transcriptional regulator [Kordiimonas sediminis]|uniref:Transcriptional regulator n=1 Tax=Kordiimonas sediminis TaxID=1735581 RepID=A0A919AY56_9PROT|nr:metalloregulator ArsR/SmtB family transcription factor [Kordiimonas sediminis]GHF29023.1 transcriptional regulator [Kordiimonas sediminis]